jgi:hypothetical protein
LRIDEGTEASIQFSEICKYPHVNMWWLFIWLYSDPVPIVPASYLIDARGVPLDIITMTPTLNRDSFMIKLNRVANSIVGDYIVDYILLFRCKTHRQSIKQQVLQPRRQQQMRRPTANSVRWKNELNSEYNIYRFRTYGNF